MQKMTDIKKAVIFWLITLVYMAAIFYVSSINIHSIPAFVSQYDKIIHACIYFPLSFLLYQAMKKSGFNNYVFIIAIIIASLYGITDEFHQSFVEGRIAALGDVFADSFGAFAGSLFASFLRV